MAAPGPRGNTSEQQDAHCRRGTDPKESRHTGQSAEEGEVRLESQVARGGPAEEVTLHSHG